MGGGIFRGLHLHPSQNRLIDTTTIIIHPQFHSCVCFIFCHFDLENKIGWINVLVNQLYFKGIIYYLITSQFDITKHANDKKAGSLTSHRKYINNAIRPQITLIVQTTKQLTQTSLFQKYRLSHFFISILVMHNIMYRIQEQWK